ncbi:MAG: hypothetical protein KDJ55_12905 [Rhodobiaceae bacterium]|nr:hypothetical protein [Rhodobiaceae bacterium]MCC0019337.1 hypothetical protein [Rhodobiaceae bacterium]MCC0051617.1 hypothetical protein [Rhodobiaceae bacterium]MCC0061427.1 hypothetical protein [Rhodobiaceae bacterium]
MISWFFRLVRRIIALVVLLLIVVLAPSAYVEVSCRADAEPQSYDPIIKDAAFQRKEANTYLTYPEWHIVYAYEGLAHTLKTGDEYAFPYLASISGFWRSFCDLNREANRHGGGDFATRATIHTIGASFTLEMGLKAAYEETIGRLAAGLRGPRKSPQDIFAMKMADDYARFLQQTPWYSYDFDAAVDGLWELPVASSFLRGWERRLALGAEWKVKAAYAGVIAGAVATTTGKAQLRIRSVVSGLSPAQLAAIAGVDVISADGDRVIIETPRYGAFTKIVRDITGAGGNLAEIAGNGEVMISAIQEKGRGSPDLRHGVIISVLERDGFNGKRLLIGTQVSLLDELLVELDAAGIGLEHIYDY